MACRRAFAVMAGVAIVALVGCGGGGGSGNGSPAINSLTAAPTRVWPSGSSALSCSASDAEGDALTYTWTANGGTFSGTGANVTWNSPTPTTASC